VGADGAFRRRDRPDPVIARTMAVVEAGGVLGEVTCAPPLTLRQVHSEARDRCELRLVGTAAGPLAGDDLSVWLRLRPDAKATLRATGASVAQGQGDAAALSIRADLADGAELVADPGALVVCRGSRIDVRVELTLGADAAVEWRELIVLGRTGEPPGRATLRWDVTRVGRPVLRQFLDLDLDLTAGHRVLACALITGPAIAPRTVVAAATAVAQRVDDHTLLVTVLDDDAARATRQLDELRARALADLAAPRTHDPGRQRQDHPQQRGRGDHDARCRPELSRGRYPARAGGLWLRRTLDRSRFHAVVVPSGLRTSVQPIR
jgi:urease accessory protein